MPTFNVHLYREMRVLFNGVTADTPEQAAEIARDKPDNEADLVEGCDGRDFAALVDVAGDAEYANSKVIDFPQPLPELAQAMHGMLQAAVDHWGKAVRNDQPINGSDAVQWLSRFVTAAAPLVEHIDRIDRPAAPKLGGPA